MDEKEFISYMTGKTFIKIFTKNENELIIEYYSDFNDYKEHNPESNVSEADYNDFFTKNTIQKIMISNSAFALRFLPSTKLVSISLNFKGTSYSVELDEGRLSEFLSLSLSSLNTKELWFEKFSNVYIYNMKNRELLFNHFVKVEQQTA
ncbi:hypothetical protein [Paenibacillus sp. 1295]|uniref:hypothetical protein n=1 Tax=Paenibacillus sp. M2 TaxID=3341793 RepID=UPI001AE8BDD7